jgi:hypothetical protein
MGGGDSPWLIGEEAVTRSSGVTDRWTVALLCTDGRPATQTKSDTTVLVGISRPLSAESICPPCNLQSLLASHLSLSLRAHPHQCACLPRFTARRKQVAVPASKVHARQLFLAGSLEVGRTDLDQCRFRTRLGQSIHRATELRKFALVFAMKPRLLGSSKSF